MTDLERLELALYRVKSSFFEGSDIHHFIKLLIHEVSRQNNIAFETEISRTKVKE